MSVQIDAIYDAGVLMPLEPLALPNLARVKLTVDLQVAVREGSGEDGGEADAAWDEELDSLLFDGPSLPPDFSRADIYSDHD